MPPGTWSAIRSASKVRLTQIAVVYSQDPTSGRYSVLANRALPCRLVTANSGGLAAFDRAELMASRDFWWDPTYVMPETAQIEVDGIRYQPRAGTFQALGDCDPPAARRCMVVRQSN